LENQFILRVPAGNAAALRKCIQNGTVKDKLSIEFQGDNRHATVRFDKEVFSAKLVDLPCIIESHKTLDKKSFYKTADICQMLVCTSVDVEDDADTTPRKDHKKFVWNNGLTLPLKNARKRRFRKTAKKKINEAPEVEKEVKRLLRADLSAVDVSFEVVQDEDQKSDADKSLILDPILQTSDSMSALLDESQDRTFSDEEDRNDELLAILQEASSDEDDGDNDKDEEEEEEEEEDQEVDIDGEMEESEDMSMDSSNGKASGLAQNLLGNIEKKLANIRAMKEEQEARVRDAGNPFLKQRFQRVLDDIIDQEQEQLKEFDRIRESMEDD